MCCAKPGSLTGLAARLAGFEPGCEWAPLKSSTLRGGNDIAALELGAKAKWVRR
jgi:hypothetical protein